MFRNAVTLSIGLALALLVGCGASNGGGGNRDDNANLSVNDNGPNVNMNENINPNVNQTDNNPSGPPENVKDALLQALDKQDEESLAIFEGLVSDLYHNLSPASACLRVQDEIAAAIQTTDDLRKLVELSEMAGRTVNQNPMAKVNTQLRSSSSVWVIFVNGIDNPYPYFLNASGNFEKALNQEVGDIEYFGFYNWSASDLCPLVRETYKSGAYANLCEAAAYVFDLAEARAQMWGSRPPTSQVQVDNLIYIAEAIMGGGDRIIFVGHSQGSLFIRDALQALGSYEGMYRVVLVATPIEIEGAEVVQMEGDIILLVPGRPDANVPNPVGFWCPVAWLTDAGCDGAARHNFMDSYLKPESQAAEGIMEAIRGFADELRSAGCRYNTDCPLGLLCNTYTGGCVDCLHDGDCGTDAECHDGNCISISSQLQVIVTASRSTASPGDVLDFWVEIKGGIPPYDCTYTPPLSTECLVILYTTGSGTISFSHNAPAGEYTVTVHALDAVSNTASGTVVIRVVGSPVPESDCPVDWEPNPENGHCYKLSSASGWHEAEAEAVALGGHLVTINDAAEQAWLDSMWPVPPYDNLHIGLRLIGGEWQWVTGETLTYTNWVPGEPNGGGSEPYGEINNNSDYPGGWNDSGSSTQRAIIECEEGCGGGSL
ncbi:MAG: lectin-like protein [Planctomycetota bacterium]